ncbi:MAG: hypothetical protein HUU21_14560 [Polyangiaceae bacterium]|nr:hypothetical protein [Polyangiaceae bacterium]
MKSSRRLTRGGRILRAGFILIAPLVPAVGAGPACTSMACLEWSEAKGECPGREEALKRFGGQSCVGEIKAVTGDPTFDGTACCYEVEKRGNNEGCVDTVPEPPPCGGCGSFRKGTVSTLCNSSVGIFNALVACLCTGPCAAACDDGSCAEPFDNAGCEACVNDPENGCGDEFIACQNDG